MSSSLENLLRTDYMPHGVCYQWIPEVLWLNVLADLLIATSYFSIPLALYYFVRRRTDLKFKGLFLLFSLFIALCGITHFVSIFIIWNGAYGLHGMLKLLTAIVSCFTAYKVYSSIPAALQLPTVDQLKKSVEEANQTKIKLLHQENKNRQERVLRDSTDSAHVGILVITGDGIISVANKAVCQIFGYEKSELENQHVNLLVSPEFKAIHTSLMAQFINSDETTRDMARNRIVNGVTKSGKSVPLEIRLTRAQHDPEIIYVSLLDISERIQHQEALASSVATTENLLAHIPLGVCIYQQNGDAFHLVHQNPVADTLLSAHADDPFLADTQLKEKMTLFCAENSQTLKMPFTTSGISHSEFQLYLFYVSAGKLAIMFEDITEQKQFEDSLIERENIIHRAINASIAGVYIFDIATRKNRFVNDRFETITGYNLNDINNLDTGINSIIHQDDQLKVINHFSHLMKGEDGNSAFTLFYRVRHANGHWLWLMAQDLVFERDNKGKPTQLIGSFLDITPQKRMQENLVSLKDKAENANHSKSEFLANMSHEIRTPMNAVIALTDMVLKMEMGNKQREYLKKVQSSSRSLLQILNDILDYSKLEAGKFEIVNEPFDLYKMLSNCIHLFSTTANQKGLKTECQIDSEVPRFVVGDAPRIAQILNNLLGNAIKFTEKGTVSLTVSSQQSTISGTHKVAFTVADTGIGIEEAKLDSLFQSFSQADGSIGRRFGGTGLGLAISQHLSKLLNGSITVDSVVDQGSQFNLVLPLTTDKTLKSPVDGKLDDQDILLIGSMSPEIELMMQFFESMRATVTLDNNLHRLEPSGVETWDIVIVDTTILTDADKTRLVETLLTHSTANIRCGIIFLSTEGYYHQNASEIILNTASAWLLTPFFLSDLEASVISLQERQQTLNSTHTKSTTPIFNNASVLVVEDHPTNQFVAIELLSAVGLDVKVAEDGYEAITVFQKPPFDLVLMDLQMPNMDGFTAAEKIRQLAVGKTVPIYAMSAAVMDADREKVTAVGMDGHIAKPVVREDLYALLERVLGKKRSPLPIQKPHDEEQAADDEALLRGLATTLIGFDLDVAIGRLGNDVHTYLGLLKNFHLHFSDFEREISAPDDTETLARRLHTMKGMSMSIGAVRLETLVKEAEHLLVAGNLPSTRELEDEFSLVYRHIGKALKTCERHLKTEPVQQNVSLPDLVEKIDSHQYLRLSDIEPYRGLLEAIYGQENSTLIINAVMNLDYKTATKLMAIEGDL